jgi:hypothetical protein
MKPEKPKKQAAAPSAIDPRFAPVAAAFAKYSDVTHGRMMSSYGLKVTGKIFAMFGRDQFVVKLPKPRVDELVASGTGKNFEPGPGRAMKEWIAFRDGKFEWVGLAKEAYKFVKHVQK